MPAYIHGADHFVTKLVSVHAGNADRDLPTVHAQVAVTEAATGQPAAYLAGTTLTNARTGCIGGVAVRAIRDGPIVLGLLGAGTQARWQARALDAAVGVSALQVYSPSDAKTVCAVDLHEELGVDAVATETPRDAVEEADVVVTATTADEPVFPGDALRADAVVIAIGAYTPDTQELDRTTMDRADRIYADVPEEVAAIGDITETGVNPEDLVPLADLLAGHDRSPTDTIVVVESVGTAVLDAAAAEHLFEVATESGVGSTVSL